jgi:hypothetical protein
MLSLMADAALRLCWEIVILVSATAVLPSYKTNKHVLWLWLSDVGMSPYMFQILLNKQIPLTAC